MIAELMNQLTIFEAIQKADTLEYALDSINQKLPQYSQPQYSEPTMDMTLK